MSGSGSSDMDDDEDMEVEEDQRVGGKKMQEQPAKKVKVGEKTSSSAGGSSPIAAPLVLAPPPVPPPGPESATMKTIHAKLDAMWLEQKKEVTALKSENKAAFKHQRIGNFLAFGQTEIGINRNSMCGVM